MRKTPSLPLILLALLALAAGCSSNRSARKPERYHENKGSFADQLARSEHIDRRVAELTKQGLSKDAAESRASREWFARAPAASSSPTSYEKARRAEEAKFASYVAAQKDAGTR